MRRRHRRILGKTLIVFVIVLVVAVSYLTYLRVRIHGKVVNEQPLKGVQKEIANVDVPEITTKVIENDPLALKGFTQVDIAISPGKMTLSKNCTAIVMTTTVQKTFSIERGIEDKLEARPDEHDMIADVMDFYGIRPLYVRISSFSRDVYYADLLLKRNNQILSLDSKPSDALAIAARFRTPVYMRNDLLEKYGEKAC